MSLNGVESIFGATRQYASKTQKQSTNKTSFLNQFQTTTETRKVTTEQYKEYLSTKYGPNVSIQNVGKDQKSMDLLGASTAGMGNVVIAPNILEQMASDPEKAAYFEGKIQWHFDTLPKLEAELSAMGHEIHSCGIVIHPDGTITRYVTGDLKPEVRAKIEAQVKAEQAEKAKRRKEYMEQIQDAAEQRRLQNQLMTESFMQIQPLPFIGENLSDLRFIDFSTIQQYTTQN